MKAGGGKAKGSGFERDVCRILTEWITGETHPEIFWRSANSGAKATMDRRVGRQAKMHGDLVAVRPEGEELMKHVIIECKFYKQGSFMEFFNEKSQLRSWWTQATHDATVSGKTPVLIFKFNRSPIFIASTIYFTESIIRWWPMLSSEERSVHFTVLSQFIGSNSWESVKKKLNTGEWF